MMDDASESEISLKDKHILPAVIFSSLGVRPQNILMAILLVDIALSFEVPVGVMSQIRSFSNFVSMAFALVMGILSIKYRPKPLFLIGISLFIVSAIGCTFSPNYTMMLISYSFTGLGVAMVTPMSQTLIGEHLDVEARPRALSYMGISFTLVSALVSSPIINWLAIQGGWRLAYLAYVFPFAIVGFVTAYFGIPSSKTRSGENLNTRTYVAAFREILSDRSAMTCIMCLMLGATAFASITIFGVSAFVERFSISSVWRAHIWSIFTFTGAIGSYFSGILVSRFGRKLVSFTGALMMGVSAVAFNNVDEFWLSLGMATLCGVGWMIWLPASTSLTLEQNPRLRGSIMSLNDAARSLGFALGSGMGGYILLKYGYGTLGLILGSIGVIASILHRRYTVDPTKT